MVVLGFLAPLRAEPIAESKSFTAEVVSIRLTRQFESKVIVAAVDPRFLATMKLLEDVHGLGAEGETVRFAIHSPTRDLDLPDYSNASGARLQLRLTPLSRKGRYYLQRETKEPRQDDRGEASDNPEIQLENQHPLNGRFERTWPTKDDLEWFRAAKGKTVNQLLQTYGTPTKTVQKGKLAEWHYPWLAVAIIAVEDGKATATYYEAGY